VVLVILEATRISLRTPQRQANLAYLVETQTIKISLEIMLLKHLVFLEALLSLNQLQVSSVALNKLIQQIFLEQLDRILRAIVF
jgi:hypothetical protein